MHTTRKSGKVTFFSLIHGLILTKYFSAHLVRWITENNQPINIINDHESHELLTAGCPTVELPSNSTISHNIHASFVKCKERITKLLQDHLGCLHFTTDVWTSLNHRAFVAWTVHLEYEGEMFLFLLDIVELPEVCPLYELLYNYLSFLQSHMGVAKAKAF